MRIDFEFRGRRYSCETEHGISIGISLQFEGEQPNHFGAPRAHRSRLEMGGFVGDTKHGGACNVDVIEMVPHCNGTHTETVGHIVDRNVGVGMTHVSSLSTATLLHIKPQSAAKAKESGESYRPELSDEDQVIDAGRLAAALESLDLPMTDSLIVVTSTDAEKKGAEYNEGNQPPFFTVEAMELIVSKGFQHLLVDIPSVDRMYDDGLLTNHHLFWNVPEETHKLTDAAWDEKTITELIFVPEQVESGLYLLNMQLPGFDTDAAPSRPVLFKPKQIDG